MTETATTLRAPFPHQLSAAKQLVDWHGCGLLGDEMGLGKSSTALWAMSAFDVYPLVIVCPLSVVDKWAKEVETTLGQEWPVSVLSHNKAKATCTEMLRVRILHHDRLLRIGPLDMQSIATTTGLSGCGGLIVDEVHAFKNRMAQRSIALRYLAQYLPRIMGLSGTMIRCDVRDLWHPSALVAPGVLGTYSSFEAHYTRQQLIHIPGMKTKNGKKRYIRKFVGGKNEEELKAKLATFMIVRKKSEVFDLPPKIRDVIQLEMGAEEKKRYDEMRFAAMVTLQTLKNPYSVKLGTEGEDAKEAAIDAIIARTALEQIIRLEQLTCGVLGGGEKGPLTFPDAAKIKWTLETIEELRGQGRSVVVFCKFNATIAMLLNQLPITAREPSPYVWVLTGDTPPKERAERINSFRKGHANPVFLCQLKMAEGFDLDPCTDVIFLGCDWTPAAMDQAEGRFQRGPGAGTVNIYYPIIKGSIDVRLHRIVIERREDARRVLDLNTVMEELHT